MIPEILLALVVYALVWWPAQTIMTFSSTAILTVGIIYSDQKLKEKIEAETATATHNGSGIRQ